MPKTLRYIGAEERWFETTVTGSPQMWLRNQSQQVSDADAALLLATGSFEVYGREPVFESNNLLVDRNGQTLDVGGISAARILALGDSFFRAGDTTECPSATSAITGTITGISVQGHEIGACTLTNGTVRTLTWTPRANTLQFGSGSPVKLARSGYILVPDATPGTGVYVSVRIPDLPTVTSTLTTTSSTARPDTGRSMLSCTGWFSVFDKQRHEVINLAGGGQTLKSAQSIARYSVATYGRIPAVVNLGVNDVNQALTFADPLAEMQVRWTALMDILQPNGELCFYILVPSNNQTESTAYLELVDKFNRWVASRAAVRQGLHVIDAWSCLTSADPSATAGRAGYINPDDLHPLAPAVQLAMYKLQQATSKAGLTGVDPFVAYPRGAASAANPGGNLLANPWQFGNSGSVPGPATGVASNNMTLTVGGVALSSLAGSKEASDLTDFIDAPWLRQTMSSATDGGFSSLTFTLPGVVAPQAGELVELIAEVRVNGDIMCPDMRTQCSGSFGGINPFLRCMVPDYTHLPGTPMPIQSYEGVIKSAPFVWPTGGVPGSTQITTYARNGTSAATVDVRRVGFRRLA